MLRNGLQRFEGNTAMIAWWRRLLRYAPAEASGLIALSVLMLSSVLLTALKPWPLKLLIDGVLQGQGLKGRPGQIAELLGATEPVVQAALLATVTAVLLIGLHTIAAVQRYVETAVGLRMSHRVAADLLDKLQRLSIKFHARNPVGDLVKRLTQDSSCVRDLVMGSLLPALTSLLSLIVMFAIMWVLAPMLALLAVAVALPLAMLIRLLAGPMSDRMYAQEEREGQMSAHAEQTLGALPVVQAFGREQTEHERFRRLSGETLRAHLAALIPQLQFKYATSGFTAIGTAGLMTIGGFAALRGQLTVGEIVVFLSYLAALYSPLETLAYLSMSFASASGRARRVLEVMDAPEEVKECPGALTLPRHPQRGAVRWENVVFGYEAGRAVLQGVSLEVRPGETVALLGATGAGKSTLVSLVPRFFDPWEGRVLVNGCDVRRATLQSLRAEIGMVLQEPFLLPLTVAENIAYARPEATEEEIRSAARAANAHQFIEQLPEGYETVIGERGVTLSGGERQRLSIARALLKNAPILILDEPTSSLDTSTEQEVMEALERLMVGRTTLIIAHRPSTVRLADRIILLRNGRIDESDDQKELLKSQFSSLVQAPSTSTTESCGRVSGRSTSSSAVK